MRYFKKLVGDRIYLSPRNAEDYEIFTQWLNDFETTDYVGYSGKLMSLQGEKDFLESNNNPEATFSIITLDGDKIIGTVGLENFNYVDRTAILGIFIGDKDYRSQGYGTEAIRMVLEYGFKYKNLHSIKLDLVSFNERAHRCYQKCGFKECGRWRESKFLNGKHYDTISMDILENEFDGDWIRNKNQ
ncbi:MAG: GNAT family N-acetyltransferase [Clostridia bacterium]|nr:GNAT family N-acetyltransferase [Clostridia bacterium]